MALRRRLGQFLAFVGRSLVWSINIGVFFYTLLIYYLLGWSSIEHWLASMFMISLPLAWLALLLLGGFWLVTRPWRSVLSGVGLLLGFWLLPRTLAVHPAAPTPAGPTNFTLLSYNVSVFGLDDFYDNHNREQPKTKAITNWIINHPAPIKCFQEFYSGDQTPTFQVIERLRQAGYGYYVLLQAPNKRYVGVATFSRYPIIRQGRHPFNSFNGMVWTDIKIGSDTIRVINIHLQSMGIRVRRLLSEKEMAGVRAETRSVLGALKVGFKSRREEIQLVEEEIARSPYPVIVTGDCNDTPYSVVYERLRERLSNAFEDAGHGFGFTLNRAPRAIRIDNQFYDAHRLQVLDFDTDRDQPYSDHFPITGRYAIRKPE